MGDLRFLLLPVLVLLLEGCLGIGTDQPPFPDAAPLRATVRFDSDDADLYHGVPTILEAALFRPPGSGPFPAIVALHDCLGLYSPTGAINSHMRDWAERLVGQGYAVLMPDSFNPRGVPEICGGDPDFIRPGVERVRDATASREWLQAQPWIAGGHIGLMGWANGGTAALTFATTGGWSHRDSGRPDFRLIVAFYPSCATLGHVPGWRPDMPLTILSGFDDDWSPARDCVGLAGRARAGGGALELVKYAGAGHDFDAPGMPIHMKAGITSTATREATIGTDPAARADAVKRVSVLLASALNP